ncbi:hypothetical protein C0992_003855 [Termitomyces sp. T32_za158]|nr:hypothetical protein C0992_003855 [Termitomyces sp. T32_za158]
MYQLQTPSNKKKRKRGKGAISEVDNRQQFQKSVVKDKDLVGQISKTPLDTSSEPQKKKRKTVSDNIEAGDAQLISPARERKNAEDVDVVVQAIKAPPNPSGEQLKKKKKKNNSPDGDSVTKVDASSKSTHNIPRPSTTSTSLLERAGEDVIMASIEAEDTAREREKTRKTKKKQEQKAQKPQGEATLPKSSSSIEKKISKRKEAHDNSALPNVQGTKESIIPVSTEPETGKSSTKQGRPHEKKKEKRSKSEQQCAEVESAVVNEQSDSLSTEAATKTQLNTRKVDKNDVKLHHVHEKEDNSSVPSVNAKKSKIEQRKLTPDERKAAEADVNAILAKVLAAKRAAVATAFVDDTSTAKQDQAVSSSRSKKKKDPKNLNSQSFDSPRPSVTTPSDASIEPLESAAEDLKSASGTENSKPTSTCPLCLLSPLHERMACPLVLGGPESLRERLLELQEASDDEQSNRTDIMSELRELLRLAEESLKINIPPPHDTQLQKVVPVVTTRLVGDISDESVPSDNDVPSHVKVSTTQTTETSNTSDDSSDDESPNHDNDLSCISHDPKFLEKLNLEDLIRGPISAATQIANLDSSDSSEDEEEKEENQVLEEDEPEVRRPRKSGGVLDSSSDEADSGLDDAQSIAEEVRNSAPNNSPRQHAPSSGTEHVSFQAVDRTGESEEVDSSANVAFGVALEMDTAIMNSAAVIQSSSSDHAAETAHSLAPSSRHVDSVNAAEATPLNRTSSLALPAGPSATQFPVSTPMTSLRDSPSAHNTRDDTKPAGIIQRMRTRNGRTPTSEKNLETQTMTHTPHTRFTPSSQNVQDGVARRTRAAVRRETLGTMTPLIPSANLGRQSRLILPASQSTEVLNISSTTEDVMSLDTWATLKPSSPVLDADATMMVDELESSSPFQHDHVDVDNHNENKGSQDGPAEDPLFLQSESLPPFPYSQWNAESQGEFRRKPDENNNVNTSVQAKSRDKLKQSQNPRYRRLTDITSDHGFLSTPTNLRATRSSTSAKKATDMYGRKDEIESESDSDSYNSDAREESHIPKSRMAGKKRK